MHLLFAWGARDNVESMTLAALNVHHTWLNFYTGTKDQNNGESWED